MGKSKKIKITERQALLIDVALHALADEIERTPMERIMDADNVKHRGDRGGVCSEIGDITDLLEWHTP